MKGLRRVAIVSPYGAEPRLDNFAEFIIAKGLAQARYSVRFYTYRMKDNPHYQKDAAYQGIPVYRCRQRLGISPKLWWNVLRYRPEVVMYFHPRSFLSFTAYIAARMVGAKVISEIVGILHDPYIVEDRDNPVETIKSDVRLFTSFRDFVRSIGKGNLVWNWKNYIFHMPHAKSDVVVAINKDEQKYIQRFYNRDSALIYWGLSHHNTDAVTRPSKEKYGTIPDSFLLILAQVKKRKGWDTAVEAIAKLKHQGIRKNLVFVCPNPHIQQAQDYVHQLGIEDQVMFLCGVSNEEKNWLYQHAQYVLAPSRYEGFGLPVFEAFQASKPLFGTDIPVYLEFLVHRENSMVSPMGDSSALAQNISQLDQDPVLRSRLVAGGLSTLEKFTDTVMVSAFKKLIDTVISSF